jgi:hypothetical protein
VLEVVLRGIADDDVGEIVDMAHMSGENNYFCVLFKRYSDR